MKIALEPLLDDVNQLKELLLLERQLRTDQYHEIKRLKQSYQQLLEQFRLAQQCQFGKSSEVSGDY